MLAKPQTPVSDATQNYLSGMPSNLTVSTLSTDGIAIANYNAFAISQRIRWQDQHASNIRLVKGQYFVGEVASSFLDTSPLDFLTPPPSPLPPHDNPLAQCAAAYPLTTACTVCKTWEGVQCRKDLEKKDVVQTFEVTEIVFRECGHAFHETCLYAYLEKVDAPTVVTCEECLTARQQVSEQDWCARKLELAIDRIKEGDGGWWCGGAKIASPKTP